MAVWFGSGFSRGARVGLRKAMRNARPRAPRPLPVYATVPGHVFETAVRQDYPAWGHRVRCSDSAQRTIYEDRNGVARRYVALSVRLANDLLGEAVTVTARTPDGLGSKLAKLIARWDRAITQRAIRAEAAALRLKQREEVAALAREKAAAVARAKQDGTHRTNLRPHGDKTPQDDPVVSVRLDPESPRRARVRLSLIERIARGASPVDDSVVNDAYWGYLNCQNDGGQFLGLRCRESAHKHRVAILTEDQSARTEALIVGGSKSRASRLIENRRNDGVAVKARSGVKPLVQIQYCDTEDTALSVGHSSSGYVYRWPFEADPYLGAWVLAGGTLAAVVAFGRGSYQGPTRQLDEFIGGNAIHSSAGEQLNIYRQYAIHAKTKQPWSARDHFEPTHREHA